MTLTSPLTPALGAPRPRDAAPLRDGARAFVDVEVLSDPAAARQAWSALEACCPASAYQTQRWVLPWLGAFGATLGIEPFVIVARDAQGAPVACLPLAGFRYGPLRVVKFCGGKEANYNLGLFRPDAGFTSAEIARLLRESARASTFRPHLYLLLNQPRLWEGRKNPLAELARRDSASPAFSVELTNDGDAFLKARLSKDARKKLRQKEKRLSETGALRHWRARTADESQMILDAFFAQKSLRFDGFGDDAEALATRAFFRAAALGEDAGEPALDLHALSLNDAIIATFGACAHRARLHGMFNSFDTAPEMAKSSPGDILLTHVLQDACARGLKTFDLGIGEARYKSSLCDTRETLADAVIAASALGRLAAPVFAAMLDAKRAIKTNPWLWSKITKWRSARASIRAPSRRSP